MHANPVKEYSNDLEAYLTLRKESVEALEKIGQDVVFDKFKEIFIKYPHLEQIGFRAYTPYFNDGDACEYSVGEYHYKIKNIPEFGIVDDDDDEDCYFDNWPYLGMFVGEFGTKIEGTHGYKKDDNGYHVLTKHNALYRDLCDLEQITSDEELCRQIYGDHVQVIVTPIYISVEEYDHD